MTKLRDRIFEMIDDHSGGVKFIELLSNLLSIHFTEEAIKEFKEVGDDKIAEYLLDELQKMNHEGLGIGVLRYKFKIPLLIKNTEEGGLLNKKLDRIKYFVYTEAKD